MFQHHLRLQQRLNTNALGRSVSQTVTPCLIPVSSVCEYKILFPFFGIKLYTNAWMPVIALPRIKPKTISCILRIWSTLVLTVNIALPFISLCYKQVGDMSTNMILITDGIATEYLLKSDL